jgi:lipopolysaccharide transport system ATP-binding protein
MPTVISVENVSKSYELGQIGTGTLTNDLKVWWAKKRGLPNPLLRIGESDHGNRDGETIWALKDVSFTVEQGEVLGIIGRNGAGKSTLLKILSRITAPTSGKVKVKGRVASLLEVGTGFHPELTGRENIHLNGAILGMNRKEIDRKFDEIVDFAEIEKFIDTPVKRYSSGMYVRLAFAVAAHLEPEILLVDEVLAVGDAAFQKKCLGKMGEVAHEGRTVLLVSHNMAAVLAACEEALLLSHGRVAGRGDTRELVRRYLASDDISAKVIKQTSSIQFLGIRNAHDLQHLVARDDIPIELSFLSGDTDLQRFSVDIAVTDAQGAYVFHGIALQVIQGIRIPAHSKFVYRYVVKSPRLSPGPYSLVLYATEHQEPVLWLEGLPLCNISNQSYFGLLDHFSGFRSPVIPEYAIEVLNEH